MNCIENRSGDKIKAGDSAMRKFDHNRHIIFKRLRTRQDDRQPQHRSPR